MRRPFPAPDAYRLPTIDFDTELPQSLAPLNSADAEPAREPVDPVPLITPAQARRIDRAFAYVAAASLVLVYGLIVCPLVAGLWGPFG